MAKTTTSLRVDDDLLAWSKAYAKERKCSWAQVVEMALQALRGDAQGGVPDLPPARADVRAAEQEVRTVKVKCAEEALKDYTIPKIARRHWA